MDTQSAQSPISTEPKKSIWIWYVIVVVAILIAGFLVWNYYGKTPTSTPTPSSTITSPANDLSAVDNELSNLDSNLGQLDKIDASEDETPSL